jgi:proteasome lid subunit RPN8/RPN11
VTGLADVDRVRVPLPLALEAHIHLQRAGDRGVEGFALWAGIVEDRTADVRATYIPAQEALRAEEGLVVFVDGAELHRLNMWLYYQGLTLIAQLHSHPGEAYHSDTDDAFPIATAIGSLSLVIPDFACAPFDLARCAVYRLSARGMWTRLDAAQTSTLIIIEE